MTDLPQSFYDEKVRKAQGTRWHIWLAAAIAFVSGWTLFGLPGAPLHLLRQPEDLPHFGFGLADVFIDDDGTWIIKRQFYADRMSRYELDSQGRLHKFRGGLRSGRNAEMEGRRNDPDSIWMPGGTLPKIKPGRRYLKEQAQIRQEHATVPTREEPGLRTPERSAIEKAERELKWEEPYLIVMTYQLNQVAAHLVLKGHSHYAVIDSWTFRNPHIWVTSDKLKYLHRIHTSDADGKVVIKEVNTVELSLGSQPPFGSRLGFDTHSGKLFLLLHSGDRYWFDPLSLEQTGHEQLPGMWEREYAAVGFMPQRPEFPQYAIGYERVGGMALTERGYTRLMRVLAVTFIAGLIWLGLELIKAWRSTSERTTAATS